MKDESKAITQELEWTDDLGEVTWKLAVARVCQMNGVNMLSDEQLSWYGDLEHETKFGKNERPWRLPTAEELKGAHDKKIVGFHGCLYWSSHGAWPYPGKLAVDMRYGMETLKQVGFWGDRCRVRLVR